MSLVPEKQFDFEEANKVLELYVKDIDPTKISRQLGLRRVDVIKYIEEWKNSKVGMEVMRDRAEELIVKFDEHYSQLIAKAYEIIEEVDELKADGRETMTRSQMLSQKKGALDLIGKFEKDRIDILQKFGLHEMDHLGDELAKMEEEKQIILGILENDLCKHCAPNVMIKIKSLLSKEGPVVVVSE